MRFHANTEPRETLDYLRTQAINAKQPSAVIDALDDLRDNLDLADEVEKLGEELNKVEGDRDDLREELEQAADSLGLAMRRLQSQLDAAQKALERHKT